MLSTYQTWRWEDPDNRISSGVVERKRDREKDCEVFIFGTSLEGTGRLETSRQVQRRQGTRPDSQLPQVQWKKHPETSLMGLICVLPINALTSYGTQFGIRNFKDVIKVTPSVLKEGDLREVHTEKMSYEDTVRRRLSASQEERSHQEPTLPAPSSWTSSLQK